MFGHARMKALAVYAVLGLAYLFFFKPEAFQHVVLVSIKMAVGAHMGMWADRGQFSWARPSEKEPSAQREARRAACIIAGMVGLPLAV